jgi:EmrB/QacA subfamily drug resistance transporter
VIVEILANTKETKAMTNLRITLATPPLPVERSAHPWWMLVVLLVGQFMGLVDVFVVNVALPSIGTELGASGAGLQLVVGGYTVAYAMFLIPGARFGELYGRRRMFLVGVLAFTVASMACGFAPAVWLLIAFRVIQGAGAALMVPQIMSVIQTQFAGPERARALSAYGVVLSTGAIAGLILGGAIVTANLFGSSWRPVFLINVPLGIALLIAAPLLLPRDAPTRRPQPGERGRQRLDGAGLLTASIAVCLIVLPLVFGNEFGWPIWLFACIAAGLTVGAFFVRIEGRLVASGGHPLLDPRVFRVPAFAPALAALWFGQIAYGGLLFAFTLYLQTSLGIGPLGAAFTWLPMAAAFGIAGFWWRLLPKRMHAALPAIGLAVCAVAYLVLAVAVQNGALASPLMWLALTLDGIGMGLSVSPSLALALARVPREQAADASGLMTTTMQLGQLIGVAAIGAVYLLFSVTGIGSPADGGTAASITAASAALSRTAVVLAAVAIGGAIPGVLAARSAA